MPSQADPRETEKETHVLVCLLSVTLDMYRSVTWESAGRQMWSEWNIVYYYYYYTYGYRKTKNIKMRQIPAKNVHMLVCNTSSVRWIKRFLMITIFFPQIRSTVISSRRLWTKKKKVRDVIT